MVCAKCKESGTDGAVLSGNFVCSRCIAISPKLRAGLIGTLLGFLGGRQKSKAKATAARKNGKLGGRPRKVAV